MGSLGVGSAPACRTLYLYENRGIQALSVTGRALALYANRGLQATAVTARALFLYENKGLQEQDVLERALYLYEATRDTQISPWLMKIDPTEQYRLGTVDLYGDGFGQFAEIGAEAGTTITASSTSGSNIPGNVVGRDAVTYWQSNDGAGAWLRFAFSSPQTLYGISLEDRVGAVTNQWGVPLFRFSDGGADVVGGSPVPIPQSANRSTEYPVGTVRTMYVFPTERTVTWVEVRVSSGGAGSARGLSQAWVVADRGLTAEGSAVLLNGETMGVVSWLTRSPGLYPANSGQPIQKAATVTVPPDAESGLLRVTQS